MKDNYNGRRPIYSSRILTHCWFVETHVTIDCKIFTEIYYSALAIETGFLIESEAANYRALVALETYICFLDKDKVQLSNK